MITMITTVLIMLATLTVLELASNRRRRSRQVMHLRLGPLTRAQREAFTRWNIEPPQMLGWMGMPRDIDRARLHPWSDRAWHERYATRHGFFWMPCPECHVPFGGHEVALTVPDPDGFESSICSPCSSALAPRLGRALGAAQ